MTVKQANKEVLKMVKKHYGSIPVAAKKWMRLYKVERIKLTFLYKIIDIAKIHDEFEEPTLRLFKVRFNDTLELLKKEAKKHSDKTVGDGALSMHELNAMIKALKEGFELGQREAIKEESDVK